MIESPFRLVRKGYETTEVDRAFSELNKRLERSMSDLTNARDEGAGHSVENTRLRQQIEDMTARMQMLEQTLADERAEKVSTLPPSYATLSERLGQMLQLAKDEADELREIAEKDTAAIRAQTKGQCASLISDAKAEAADIVSRGQAEAERIVEIARQKADQTREESIAEATVRLEEAEAVYEAQRAQAAQAAVEFEQGLAARREQATGELNTELEALNGEVKLAEERLTQARAEAEQSLREARKSADSLVREAQSKADALLSDAKLRAEGIRQNSERELAAATARRDSITSQLANVRQMLATLGGPTNGGDGAAIPTAEDWATGSDSHRSVR